MIMHLTFSMKSVIDAYITRNSTHWITQTFVDTTVWFIINLCKTKMQFTYYVISDYHLFEIIHLAENETELRCTVYVYWYWNKHCCCWFIPIAFKNNILLPSLDFKLSAIKKSSKELSKDIVTIICFVQVQRLSRLYTVPSQ